MAVPVEKPWTVEDFLAWEYQQPERWEFVDGEVRMMVGGSFDHNSVALGLASYLRQRLLPRGCRVFMESVKVRAADCLTYPDVVVTCMPVRGKDGLLCDATLIAEVLSPSTANYDRGDKWEAYRNLPSLSHYLLIAQDRCCIDLYSRDGERWMLTRYDRLDQELPLTALEMAVPLAEIYAGTEVAHPSLS